MPPSDDTAPFLSILTNFLKATAVAESVWTTLNLGIFSGDGDAGCERPLDGEDDGLGGRRHDGERHVEHRVVAADQHPHRVDPVTHGVLRLNSV